MRTANEIVCEIFIASIILAIYSPVSFAGDWNIVTLDPSILGENSYLPSIALDGQARPHISYVCEQDYPPWVRYAYWNGDNWVVDSLDWWDYFWNQPKIKLDGQDLPYILFSWDEFNLQLAHYDGANWTFETIDLGLSYSVFDFSLALDGNNRPQLSYDSSPDEPYMISLVYAYKQGDVWVNEIVDASGDFVGEYNSIAVDSHNYPNISYNESPNGKIKYARWNGSQWEISVVDSSIWDPHITSIAIDQQDNPHICYYRSNGLYYASWNGSEWIIQLVDFNVDTVSGYTLSLILDSQDRPHISYYDYGTYAIKYAYFNGTNWNLETIDTVNGGYNCIALNSLDQPWIVYEQCSDSISHLKLAWQGDGGGLVVDLLSFTATPQEDSISLNWQVECTEGEQIAGFNLYRREINNDIAAEVGNLGCIWTKVNNFLITGQNPYAYTDSAVEPGKTYEYRLEAVLSGQSAQTLGTTQATTEQPVSFAIVSLYPNPVTENLSISITDSISGEMKLKLYDLSGRLVMERNYPIESGGCEITISLDSLSLNSGLYTVKLEGPQFSKTSIIVYVPQNE